MSTNTNCDNVSAEAADVTGDWQVTYLNNTMGQRCVLIDDIDMGTAIKVLATFGSTACRHMALPEVRIERMKQEEVPTNG